MSLKKHLLKRLLFTLIPLLSLYLFAQISFETSKNDLHRGDSGLGIVFLLIFILLVLFFGFIIDSIIKIRRKEYKIFQLNILFLLPIILFLSYFLCLMTSRCFFCEALIDWVRKLNII